MADVSPRAERQGDIDAPGPQGLVLLDGLSDEEVLPAPTSSVGVRTRRTASVKL